MLGSPQKCSTKDDCPNNVCYDQKYCVAVDPVSGKGVCYYGPCKRDAVCDQAYPQCSSQYVPTFPPAFVPTVPIEPTTLPTSSYAADPVQVTSLEQPSKGLSTGAIVGIAIGGVVFLVLLIGGIWWWKSRARSDSKTEQVQSPELTYKTGMKSTYLDQWKKRPLPVSQRPV